MSTPPPPVPGSTAPCARHPDRPTALACTRCGRPACPDCLREASVGQHCVDCLAQAARSAPRYRTGGGADRPTVVIGLIVLNVAVFALTVVAAGSVGANDASTLFSSAALVPGEVADGQWWRLLTSGFLHFGPLHLVFNMVALWVIGNDLERFLGHLRFVVLYGLSLLGGSAAVMVLTGPGFAVAGASGAVFGLMGALAVLLLRRGSISSAGPVLTIIGINVAITLVPGFGLSIAGHFGGLLTGALVALALTEGPGRNRPGAALAVAGSLGLVIVATIVLRAVSLS